MKEEALKLADWLDKSINADDWDELAKYYQWCHENVSPMIRRLVEELDKQTKPLSDKEIFDIWFKNGWGSANNNELIEFARAILRKAQEK